MRIAPEIALAYRLVLYCGATKDLEGTDLAMQDFLRFAVVPVAVALSATVASVASAGDAKIGESIATPCVACHGENGAAPILNYPILAGQHEDYLKTTLIQYKSGKRNNAVMSAQVAQLTERDMANLAAYFASQGSPLR